jgi:hypothetical protein
VQSSERPTNQPTSARTAQPSSLPSWEYLVIVQLLIPVKQRLQTDVSREAFIADPTTWDNFKDGVVAALEKSPRSVPYSRENVVIDSVSAVTARRRLPLHLQGSAESGYSAIVTGQSSLSLSNSGGALDISYYISLIELNVDPDTYTASPAFAAHFAAIAASRSSPAARSSIAASLAASRTAMQVTVLPASIASSPGDVVVKVLQGPPTAEPTPVAAAAASSSDALDALLTGWPRYAVFAAVFVAGYVLVVCLVRCLRRLRLRATTVAQAQLSVFPSSSALVSPEEALSGGRLVGTGINANKVTFPASIGGRALGNKAAGKWGAQRHAAEADAIADYAIDVREHERAFESDSNGGSKCDRGGTGGRSSDIKARERDLYPAGSDLGSQLGDSSADSTDGEAEAAATTYMATMAAKMTAAAEREASLLEQRHLRAAAMFERVCKASELTDGCGQVLLVVHGDLGASTDAIAFLSGTHLAAADIDNDDTAGAVLQPRKIPRHIYQHLSGVPMPVYVAASDAEMRSRYRVELVGDEERDYPGVTEMPVPHCVAAKHPACAHSTGRFLGAVNLPLLMRDVIIDIWGVPDHNDGDSNGDAAAAVAAGPRWATATVDGVAYAVLERLCIGSDSEPAGGGGSGGSGGSGGTTEVQMFARHPRSSMLVLERYTDQ